MSSSRSHVRVALSSGASASEPGREFVQERLRVFGFWSCILSFFFLALRFVGEALVDPSFSALRLVGSAGFLFHACASGVGGLLWRSRIIRRRCRSLASANSKPVPPS